MRLLMLSCVMLMGCGGVGEVTLTTWGEDYIEQGLPAELFEDGFSVRYSKFLVVIKDFEMAKRTGEQGPRQAGPLVVDVTKPGPLELAKFSDVDALKYDQVSYGIGPASDAIASGEVAATDVELMKAGNRSIWVEGTVSKGAVSKRFSWAFSLDTHYSDCTNPDFGEGVTVPNGGQQTVELTLHGDHFWYDDLQSPEAKVRGTAIVAADSNDDGEVTLAELAAVQLTSLPLSQYGTGSLGNVKTLADFVTALGRTIGHFRGEGECTTASR
jgi:hypothetical protein